MMISNTPVKHLFIKKNKEKVSMSSEKYDQNEIESMLLKVKKSGKYSGIQERSNTKWLRKHLNSAKVSHSHKGSWRSYSIDNNFQNSVVKVSYAGSERPNQWGAHGRYLEREGAQVENQKGSGFNRDSDDIAISKELDHWQKSGDERIFKIIASPEQAPKLDLKDHVRTLMKKMESDFGIKLQWIAIDHYNTDNPHAHIVIRGVDEKGEALTISKNYIQKGIRYRSREVATQKIGIRLKEDIISQRQKAVEQKRITSLDRELMRMTDEKFIVKFDKPAGNNYQTEKNIHLIKRLQFLTSIGFAEKVDKLGWMVKEDLLEGLKIYQNTQDIIKRKGQHISQITDSTLPLSYTTLKEGEQVVGRVVGFGLDNEQYDKRYMLVEGADGKVHYMKPSKNVLKDREALLIENGDVVLIEGKVFKKDEEQIPYIVVENYKNLVAAKAVTALTGIDNYLIKTFSKENSLKDLNVTVKTFHEKFTQFKNERIMYLQKIGLLNKSFVIKKYEGKSIRISNKGRRLSHE